MSDTIEVKYSFSQRLSYSGTVRMKPADYEKLKDKPDEELAAEILEYIDANNPIDWGDSCIDTFEAV